MKTFLSCALIVSSFVSLSAFATTRSVDQGDVMYSASGYSPQEERAVFLAEARAARLLQIECGAVPKITRVYRFENRRQPDGTFAAEIEMGVALADCEQMRRASPEAQARLANSDLQRQIAQYIGQTQGSAPVATSHFVAAAPAPLAAQPNRIQDQSLSSVLWTVEQEESHLRSIQARLKQRLHEREHIALVHQ